MIGSKVIHNGPTTGLLGYWIGRIWMLVTGWNVKGEFPKEGKFVIIGTHTSNWDFPFMLAAVHILRLKVSWMGKDSLFKKPFGSIMKFLGGIPIDRSKHSGLTKQVIKQFETSEKLAIIIPPSGTRGKAPYWKSGFYWIANGAKIPILCGYIDYKKKEVGIGYWLIPTGNIRNDMDKIRAFYKNIEEKYPEKRTPIRLKEELS